MQSLKRPLFFLVLLCSATPWCGPAMALTAGMLFSLFGGNPAPKDSAVWSKKLLQWSVVGLGFGVSIVDVWHAASEAVLYTPLSIVLTVAVGLLLGRMLATPAKASALISLAPPSAAAALSPPWRRSSTPMTKTLLFLWPRSSV